MPGTRERRQDPLLQAANIKSSIVAALVARADELGVPCEDWFAGLRLGHRHFIAPMPAPYLSYREACLIIQRALESLPGDGHGLELGSRQSFAEFGLIGLAMMTVADFGEALRLGMRYAPITGAMLDLDLDEDDPDGVGVTLRMRTREPAIEAYLCEELIASSLKLCRGLLGDGFHSRRIDLAYPAPPYAGRYADVLAAPVAFDRPDTRVVIDRHWMAVPMPAANPDTARQLVALCRAQMPSGQPPSALVAALEPRIAMQLASNPRLTDLAAELHLTERTLRRQLRAAGTSFRELLDRARAQAAHELLRDRRLPVSQVAAAVGFRDVRDFRRAFKRWTGRLPREMRDDAPVTATGA